MIQTRLMKLSIHLAVMMSTLLIPPVVLAQRTNAVKPIESVLITFWEALGREDGEAMKQTFDWPVTIVEVSQTTSRKTLVLHDPAEFDKVLAEHHPAKGTESGKGEFYGIKLLRMKVAMLSPNVAYVSYTGIPPANSGGSGTRRPNFSAVAILRKLEGPSLGWRIVFMTVPA
ncbi:MAG: hypothetical protein ACRD9S_16350 [Pyrinomonadaceae bacterium]